MPRRNILSNYRIRRRIRREAALARREPDTMAQFARFAADERLMTVTVRDRVGGPVWLLGLYGPRRTVEVGRHCPVCGEPRGVPRWRRVDRVQTWNNPCGHRDRPCWLITEADQTLLGAHRTAHLERVINGGNSIRER